MRRLVVIAALCCLASVAAEDEGDAARNDTSLASNQRSLDTLILKEVRKTFGLVSPRAGRDHNILKVELQSHAALPNITKWELQLGDHQYIFMDDDPFQTQLEFGAQLTDTDKILIFAKNNNILLDAVIAPLEIRDMKSRVARVGGGYDPSLSSLRVVTGALQEVEVGGKLLCRREKSPCYYLRTQLPEDVPRCQKLNYTRSDLGFLLLCDDTITSFREIPGRVMLKLEEDMLTVEANFTMTPATVEVVVFDPEEPTKVFSPDGFECRVQGQPRQFSHVCHQQVTGAQDLSRLLVLVVSLDKEGFVIESRMYAYGDAPTTESVNKGVIVGCVLGVLGAIVLIAGIFVYCKGKKEKKSSSATTNRGPSKYERTATTEPPAQEEEA